MIKKFFITMLGSMAAIWLSLLILILLSIGAVGVIIGKSMTEKPSMDDKSILLVELSGNILEREPTLSLTDVLNLQELGKCTFTDITTAIRNAAKDKEIKGIAIECKGSELGLALRGELLQALQSFKDSGKWIYAYADNYTQGDYYVAAIADKVFLNPVGMVDVHGLGTSTMFFKNLLDKVGVEVQVVKVGEYKSAVEPYIRTSMSEPSREQTSVFLNQIWVHVAGKIAANRGVEEKAVNVWADSIAMTWAPEKYLSDGIVSELAYHSDFEYALKQKVGTKEDKDAPTITVSDYLSANSLLGKIDQDNKHIAVYYAVGEIVDSGEGGIVGAEVVPDIEKLAKDDNVAGLVLRVNSPGGSAFASEQIWHALENFKATGKPFYVSMGDYAASGGYYISCGADSIYADPATLTGSIGIFGLIPNAKKLLTDKIGIDFDVVETNPNALFPVINAPMTAQQYAAMQKYVERGYETFTSRVAAGRDMPIDSVKAIGGGRVWDGMTAIDLGLVDHLGSMQDAIQAMASKLNMSPKNCVAYPTIKEEWWNALVSSGLVKAGLPAATSEAMANYKKYIDYAKYVTTIAPVQARMEPMAIE